MQRTHLAVRRSLRAESTDAERLLWRALRTRLRGTRFRRQHSLGDYVVDFYCASAALVIEVDGGQHYEEAHAEKDARRTRALEALGLRVLRFTNREVMREIDVVLGVIAAAVSPSP